MDDLHGVAFHCFVDLLKLVSERYFFTIQVSDVALYASRNTQDTKDSLAMEHLTA